VNAPDESGIDRVALSRSMVRVRAAVPEDAFTASILGTERSGNGIVIGTDGLVLTIGYLITEADDVWLTNHAGREIPGHALAYDQVTGFGLILPLGGLDVAPLPLGDSSALRVNQPVHVLSHPQLAPPQEVKVLAVREFAGAWEYLLDEALFTAPAHTHWSGAALIDASGGVVGLGSLLVRELSGGKETDANMFVPTDLLKPLLGELRSTGKVGRTPRPWLGLYAAEIKGVVVVAGVAEGGPAQRADIREGDLIREVGNREVSSMAEFYRSVWSQGPAGTSITLTTTRGGKPAIVKVRSIDRTELLKRPRAH
jgi:S1-C subfamily serine protease